ncbi:LOW QUALITY PROTEIN: uncharacterized protein ACBR49_019187 [Aulostomus maculatus]
MAEARSEEEEVDLRRDGGEPVVRRQPNTSGGRADRRKPDRHSQGPLSSIRAAIKRTSARSTSLSETTRDRERDQDRRRPEITILSSEPLASTSWFPGASQGFLPPPPPTAQIWGPLIPPTVQPPPSYEEVIREKTQEQVLLHRPSVSTTTIATQTEAESSADPQKAPVRPIQPPRPRLSYPSTPSDISGDGRIPNLQCCILLTEICSPLACGTQTDQWEQSFGASEVATTTSSHAVPERPRPRPRSRLSLQAVSSEVKVQTLVKLREDGLATLAAHEGSDTTKQEVSPGKYLQELLEAFSSDAWGAPDHRSESGSEQDSEDMAALPAKTQTFEQQQENEGGAGDADPGKPEPRPRPRLQGQPAKLTPPTIAPKPKSFSHAPKPSSKGLWEDGGVTNAVLPSHVNSQPPATEAVLAPQPQKTLEKPSMKPKPPCVIKVLPTSTPVPAPRPPPPKRTPSLSDAKPPPRPPVAPRERAPQQEKASAAGCAIQTLPPRSSTDVNSQANNDRQENAVQAGSVRPDTPFTPAVLTSSHRASAPSLAPPPCQEPSPAQAKPPGPAPAARKSPLTKADEILRSSDSPLPPWPSRSKLSPFRPPPVKSIPGRPPPPTINSSLGHSPPTISSQSPPLLTASSSQPSETANHNQGQRATKKGPPLPPRPNPGHPLYCTKQEVLIVLDDPVPSEQPPGGGRSQTPVTALIKPSCCLLDLDAQPQHDHDYQSKPALEGVDLSESQSILPRQPPEQKEQPDPPPASGPRCVALFDYEGEEDDELTFSQGDVIALLELIGEEWGRGQIHGRFGMFPLSFTEVVELLPQPALSFPGEGAETTSPEDAVPEATRMSCQDRDPEVAEWAVALFDFPGQTSEDLSFHKGALIRVTEHVDSEWRRGQLEGREGLFPVAFTHTCQAQPVLGQHSGHLGVARALFDFTAEREDELTLKVGDIITQVQAVNEQWILGVVGKKHGMVPRNYISLL